MMKCGAHTYCGSHTEWEVCLWITAVRKFEGVRLIHLFAINSCLDKNTFSANIQIRSVSKSRSHCSISIIIKCLSLSQLSFVRLTASLLLLLQICCRLFSPHTMILTYTGCVDKACIVSENAIQSHLYSIYSTCP